MAYPCCFSPSLFLLLLFITKLFQSGLEKNKVEPVSFFLLSSHNETFGWREEANLFPGEATELSETLEVTAASDGDPLAGWCLWDLLPGAVLDTLSTAQLCTLCIWRELHTSELLIRWIKTQKCKKCV